MVPPGKVDAFDGRNLYPVAPLQGQVRLQQGLLIHRVRGGGENGLRQVHGFDFFFGPVSRESMDDDL